LWALGEAENAHLSLSSHQDMYTFLSKSSRREEMPSSFHVIEARLHRQVDSLARMGQVRQEEAEVEAAREHLDYLPIVVQPSLTAWTDSLNIIKLLNRLTLQKLDVNAKSSQMQVCRWKAVKHVFGNFPKWRG
jgi:hypothetical protein